MHPNPGHSAPHWRVAVEAIDISPGHVAPLPAVQSRPLALATVL